MVIGDLIFDNIYKLRVNMNNMQKRGQVTLFVIIGIVLIILIGLGYYVYDLRGIGIPVETFLASNMQPVKENAMKCMDDVGGDLLNDFISQGGVLSPDNYLLYKGDVVPYLCSDLPGKECLNHLRTKEQMEDELENAITLGMNDCIDKDILENIFAGYEYNIGDISTDVQIMDAGVLLEVDYPVELTKKGYTEKLDTLNENIEVPLGGMYDVVYDILQQRTVGGDFETVPYMLENRGEFEITVDKPYPDEVYIINAKNSDYKFQFAIEGVE